MIFDQGADNLNAWKTEMKMYEKGKRTKKPFGNSVPSLNHVTYEEVKDRELTFNPILQKYRQN